jgi:hypothetical protein
MRKVTYENFKTIESMLDIFETREVNKAFKHKESLASVRVEESKRFTGVKTYNEAIDIMKEGYKDPLEKMKKAILKIGEQSAAKRPRIYNDFVGFAPNVPNHLMNVPLTMINRQKQPNKSKNIHLTYSFCALSNVTTDELIQGGINFISLVNSLEKQGYRAKIDIMFCSVVSKSVAAFTVTVKEYGQNLNLLKLAFPLIHPAMLRRITFKWLETMPTVTDKEFANGYGQTVSHICNNNGDKERAFLEKAGILKGENNFYCNVYQAFQSKDIESLATKMQLAK